MEVGKFEDFMEMVKIPGYYRDMGQFFVNLGHIMDHNRIDIRADTTAVRRACCGVELITCNSIKAKQSTKGRVHNKLCYPTSRTKINNVQE